MKRKFKNKTVLAYSRGRINEMEIIAHIHNDFSSKFGLPRQSGLVPHLPGRIVFTPPFRDPQALRGLEGFSHLWLLWEFSEHKDAPWSATVRPPRLGGNRRMGVFATRAPYRPNPIGLSCVQLLEVRDDPQVGPVLWVAGADLMDGTPIYDIKPYLPFTDSHPEARAGFAAAHRDDHVEVVFPQELLELVPQASRQTLVEALALDPRPAYQDDPERLYGFEYAGLEVRFCVQDAVLTVREVVPLAR